jgi:hypothetical protein
MNLSLVIEATDAFRDDLRDIFRFDKSESSLSIQNDKGSKPAALDLRPLPTA